MKTMTRKEAYNFMIVNSNEETTYRIGYGCYQEDKISKFDLMEIGYNHGIYGWNWTLYYSVELNRYYINSYRNTPTVPAYFKKAA